MQNDQNLTKKKTQITKMEKQLLQTQLNEWMVGGLNIGFVLLWLLLCFNNVTLPSNSDVRRLNKVFWNLTYNLL